MFRTRTAGFAVLAVLAAGVVLPAGTASADTATRYVDIGNAACSDSGTGSQAQPYCTLQAATDAAQPGDTVHVASGGTYPATTINTSGEPGKPLTINGDNFIRLPQLSFSGVHDVVLHGLQLVLSTGGVEVRDASDVTLDGLNLDPPGGSSAVAISGQSSDVTVRRSYLSADGVPGVEVGAGVRRAVITTDEFSVTNGSGIALDGAVDTAVTSNTFEPEESHALSVSAGSTGTTVENNLLTACDIVVSADSAAQSTAGYNLFHPLAGGDLYQWAGTKYTDVADFQAATGQGRMDILGSKGSTIDFGDRPAEGDAAIDSADADAPGELATDIHGAPRVDDLLTANTGTGVGYVDRGAVEVQDPYHSYSPRLSPSTTEVGHPVSVVSRDENPWGTAVTRTYDFGDGTPVVTSTADSVQHTYATLTGGKSTTYTITVTEASHVYQVWAIINPPGPLVAALDSEERDPSAPLTVTFYDQSSSPFQIASCKRLNFGDGTPTWGLAHWDCAGVRHTYAKAGTYTVTSVETDLGGRSARATTKVVVGPVFVPLAHARILDTRSGLGAPKATVGAGKTVHLKVNGAGGVSQATSVLLNVTVTHATSNGSITAYASGAKRPAAPSLTYRRGQTGSNLVSVPLGPDGAVTLYNSAGSVDLLAEVQGYSTLAPGWAGGTVLTSDADILGNFRPLMDTTGGSGLPKTGKLGAGKSVTFTALLQNVNSPYEYQATAVILDVTETHATAGSYVTAYEPGSKVPNASDLTFAAGETRSATIVVPVDSQGRVSLYNHAGSVDLSVTMEGFYLPSPSVTVVNHPFTTTTPARVLDTRSGLGASKKPIAATGGIRFKAAGVAGIPAGATGVLLNLTAVGPTANGSLTVWGDRTYQPSVPALSFMRGQTTSVLVYLPLSHGYVGLYNPYGSVNAVAEVEAYSTN